MEWKLIAAEGLLRATRALEVPGGVIVRTTDRNDHRVAMSSDLVPGAKIVPTREINEINEEQIHRLVPAYSDPDDMPEGFGEFIPHEKPDGIDPEVESSEKNVNCPDCGGDGFESYEVGDDTPCVLCGGTGKVAP